MYSEEYKSARKIHVRKMDWFRVIFVMVIVNQLDSIQDEVDSTDETIITTTEILEMVNETTAPPECEDQTGMKAYGCLDEERIVLYFRSAESINIAKIQSETEHDKNCYEFIKINDSFVINTQSSLSYCSAYILFSDVYGVSYHMDGSILSEIEDECPYQKKLCVMKDLKTRSFNCPLTNFTVSSVSDKDYGYINLNVSWQEVDNDKNVSIKIIPNTSQLYKNSPSCSYSADIFYRKLFENNIIKPDTPTEIEVEPGCTYDIFMYPEDGKEKFQCALTYTVPDCVERKCDCDKFKPQPRILSVKEISENKFFIKWDPGEFSDKNKSYTNERVSFFYKKSDAFYTSGDVVKEIKMNLKDHTSEVVMQLFEGVNYTLTGSFMNNFTCRGLAEFEFTAPMKSNVSIGLILLCVLAALVPLILVIKCCDISKFATKLLNYVGPARASPQNHELTRLQPDQILIPMNTNIQYTPIELMDGSFDEYEFPRNRIIVKEAIGSGAFGQVYSAKAIGIGGIEGYRMVAIKTLGEGENITRDATNDFKAEIEIFKKIGHHPNIVALLGCCTVDAPLIMIMEFVPCGDLKNYLLELREQWRIKKSREKSKQIFFPDNSDGAYIVPATPTTPISITSSRLPSTSDTISTILDDPMSPMTPVLANYVHTLDRVLDHTELQNFALQIAKGMAHLEKIPITHRDLAARNILINEYKTLKISDFGLSRSGPYINHKPKKLPLRWMAIEAIVNQQYDSKSDAWSFGVVLWEIGTLGAFPYESVPDSYLQQFLQIGRRLERPEICTDDLYSLMKQCWATDPEKRPTFQELVDALDVKKRKIYVNFDQLNPTYVFPPSEIQNCVQNPVRIVDISI